MTLISRSEPTASSLEVADAFNYAIVIWGATGKIRVQFFAQFVECDLESRLEFNPNTMQCAALAYWAIGNLDEARLRMRQASNLIQSRRQTDFSCWRYLNTTTAEFQADLFAMGRMIDGEPIIPEVIKLGAQQTVS
jgi:hypothetical protein